MEDILNYVYNLKECEDYNILQEDTSLQKSIKEKILKGKTIKQGIAVLNNN